MYLRLCRPMFGQLDNSEVSSTDGPVDVVKSDPFDDSLVLHQRRRYTQSIEEVDITAGHR